MQVRGEIGRIASPGPSFSLWLLLLGASEVSSRLGLYTAFSWSSRPSAALAAVVVLSLAAVNPLVYATFGGDRMRGGSYLTGAQEKVAAAAAASAAVPVVAAVIVAVGGGASAGGVGAVLLNVALSSLLLLLLLLLLSLAANILSLCCCTN